MPAPKPSPSRRRSAARGPRTPRPVVGSPRRSPGRVVARSPAAALATADAVGVTRQHLAYTSHMMDEVRRFYIELLGFRSFTFDPAAERLVIRTAGGATVGFTPPRPGPPEDWRPPREPQLVFEVENVDRAHRELSGRGVEFQQPPTDVPSGYRIAVLRDPEGRAVCLVQEHRT